MKKEMLINVQTARGMPDRHRRGRHSRRALRRANQPRELHREHLQGTNRQSRAGDPGRVRRLLGRPQRLPARLGHRIPVLRTRRGPAPTEPEPAAPRDRDRDRRRDPRREGDRNRGRDPRRRPPGPAPSTRRSARRRSNRRLDDRRSPATAIDDRDRPRDDRTPRDRRAATRDRNRDRPRDRERPDLSIKGRRDRSEPQPRRFGEGLVSQPEPWPEPEPELPSSRSRSSPSCLSSSTFRSRRPRRRELSPPAGPNHRPIGPRIARARQQAAEPAPGWAPDRGFLSPSRQTIRSQKRN